MARLPTIISFFCGGPYYYDCAERLASDCKRLNLPYDIEEIHVPADVDWSQICREKVPFYERKLKEQDGPVLWVDVDCRIVKVPRLLEGCRLDFMAFAQRFRYIRDYDPYDTVRFWVPGVVFFNNTPAALEFVALMNRIERATTERITDDYCLHEAWTTYEGQLNVGMFAPKTVSRTMANATDDTIFIYGASGNVATHKGTVLQHTGRDLLSNPRVAKRIKELHSTPQVRASVLDEYATEVRRSGDRAMATALLRRAVAINPADAEATQHLAEVLRMTGEIDEAIALLEGFLAEQPATGETRRMLIKFALISARFDTARDQIAALEADPEERWRNYARSATFDLYLEERAAQLGLSKRERTPLWWMRTPHPGNFGDTLSPYIVERISGTPPRLGPRTESVLAIGSIIKFAGAKSRVWGSGTARRSDTLAADAQYTAVRGPLTRDSVLRSGGSCPEVFGDPALLLPRLYTPKPTGERFKVGVIRHLQDRGQRLVLEGPTEISIVRVGHAELEQFIDEVAACEAVLSTSLHGLITAHAYGIPARWCTFGSASSAIPGDGTKFEDYFRSVGLRSQQPLDLSQMKTLDDSLVREIDPDVGLKFNADDLLEAFPR